MAAIGSEGDNGLTLRFGQDPGVSAGAYFALILFGLGQIDRARSFAEQAFARALRSGHTATIVYGQFMKSTFEVLAGSPERAAPHAKATTALGREHGMSAWVLIGIFYEGWVLSFTDPEHAIPELRRGLALCREAGVLNWLAQMVAMQAAVESDAGYVEDGLARIDDFLAETQPVKQRWLDAELHRHRGALLKRRTPAEPEAAEAGFKSALAIARNQQTKTFELRAATALARLWYDQGKRVDAHDLLAPVYGSFTEGFDTPDLKKAKALLSELAS